MAKKMLVAYFSASGVTEKQAKALADALGADLYPIRPETPYTPEDLDWRNAQSRSSIEMKNPSFRPALADRDAKIEAYDTILLGFPIWWYVAPTIINTFLESYDFADKRIILFVTSGSSGFGNTVDALRKSVPDSAILEEGIRVSSRAGTDKIIDWAKTL